MSHKNGEIIIIDNMDFRFSCLVSVAYKFIEEGDP